MLKNRVYLAVTFLFIIGVALIASPAFTTYLNYVGLHALVCLGLVFLTGYIRVTSFGQAAFVGIGAYTTAILVTRYGWDPYSSLLVAMLLSAFFAFLIGWLTINLAGHYLVLGTMVWGISIYLVFGNVAFFGGFNGISGIPTLGFSLFDLPEQKNYLILIWIVVLLFFWGSLKALNSRQGRAIRVLQDPLLASSFGIQVNHLKVKTFVVAAVFASVSGWFTAHYLSVVNPGPFGINASVDYLFMTVVGGVSNIFGALVGPAVVEALRVLIRDNIPSFLGTGGSFEVVLFGLIVIVILQRAGGGILDLLGRKINFGFNVITDRSVGGLKSKEKVLKPEPILEVKHLVKKFGGLVASNNISFDLNYGELVGVIGPNGAGKSTLFNMLSGVFRPTSGRIEFQGVDISKKSAFNVSQLGIARTFQHVRLQPAMTVLENVAVGAYSRGKGGLVSAAFGLGRKEEQHCINEAYIQLERIGLAHLAHAKAGSLALGQQRLVEIARALASDPMLLLLDEPAAGLRFQEKQDLAQLLKKLKAEHLTILLVEHDMQFVMQLADRLVVLQYGERIAFGKTAEVQKDRRVIDAYLGAEEA